ncbi:uncharacterized protein BO66DRAFT_442121 [Aspergillus aculeatinus CBS 121060]|uniref:Uncharacterized protein n=1 Tax=Aspergillus aculeatinus CBS 121060 TaxID=1448322 RepID=A0ACD1GYQ6_9EURO|nr:hypothetical protein BO66DRAFT_442121 [Aspergillus aculeatinus CBS 121060]RAH66320.1 hypothetical protein BO66DRAFT_442121 [Aspergillus aculeatinus CBS 121060]
MAVALSVHQKIEAGERVKIAEIARNQELNYQRLRNSVMGEASRSTRKRVGLRLSDARYEVLFEYIDFGADCGPPPEHLYKMERFERWFVGYQKECLGYGREEWRDVAPLY